MKCYSNPTLQTNAVSTYPNQQLVVQPSPILNDSIFYNSQDNIRLSLVHKHFGLMKDVTGCKYVSRSGIEFLVPTFKKRISHELSQSEIGELIPLYTEWRDQAEYLPLRLTYEDGKRTWNFMKVAKRGNDVYCNNIKKAFAPFTDPNNKNFQQQIWFDPDIFVSKKTHMLYVTLEYNSSTCGLCDSWFNVGTHFNSFITNLRNKFTTYGIVNGRKKVIQACKIVFLRGWHAHESGYPHIHVLIYFRDIEFSTVFHNGVWRLSRKKRFPGAKQTIKQDIADCWDHGFVDIRCASDTKKAFKDIVKYTTNDFGFGKEDRLTKGKCDLTNTLLWYFGKQSYGLSVGNEKTGSLGFFDTIFGEASAADCSIDNVDANGFSPITSNSNSPLSLIEVLPTVKPEFLEIPSDVIELIGADPPPRILLDLDNLIDECSSRVIDSREDGVTVIIYSRRYQ